MTTDTHKPEQNQKKAITLSEAERSSPNLLPCPYQMTADPVKAFMKLISPDKLRECLRIRKEVAFIW